MNYGQPINTTNVVSLSQATRLFSEIRKSGRVARIDFEKKSDGRMRTMVCRMGVRKYASGKGNKGFSFADKGLLPVYEFGKGYRSIPIDNITGIKFNGCWYDFRNINGFSNHSHASGQIWHAKGFNTEYRTKQSYTSPLFK